MRAVFINLDGAGGRRAFMERQFARLGIALERAPAVTADAIPDETAARIGRSWERPLSKPELGCFLSHHAIWEQVSAGQAPVLVLEDDVVVSPRIGALLDAVATRQGSDILNLESFEARRFVRPGREALPGGLSLVSVSRDKSGSAAYVLWPSGARKLIDRAAKGAAPADAFLHGLKCMRAFQVEPALAMQVHLLERRGFSVPIPTATSIQVPRGRLPLTRANLPFHARRVATQLKLFGEHLRCLVGNRYRRVDIVEAEFVLPSDEVQRRS